MNRRRFLQMGLFGGALLALGGTGLGLWSTRRRHQPRRPLAIFDEREFAILAAAAERIVTAPGANPVAIAHNVDESFTRTPPEAGADFKRFLGLVESALSGLLLDGRPRPFTRLDAAGQDAALRSLRDSRFALVRGGYQSMRKLCLAAHYANETSWAFVGYPGPPDIRLPPDFKVAE